MLKILKRAVGPSAERPRRCLRSGPTGGPSTAAALRLSSSAPGASQDGLHARLRDRLPAPALPTGPGPAPLLPASGFRLPAPAGAGTRAGRKPRGGRRVRGGVAAAGAGPPLSSCPARAGGVAGRDRGNGPARSAGPGSHHSPAAALPLPGTPRLPPRLPPPPRSPVRPRGAGAPLIHLGRLPAVTGAGRWTDRQTDR